MAEELIERMKDQIDSAYLIPTPIPSKNMLIELSNICNDRCLFCANRKMTRKKGMIDEGFLRRILNEAISLGVQEVGFYTTGEPFVSPDLARYIKYAKEIGFRYVYITTNGALATPDRAKAVIDAGIDSIKFSINASCREDYLFIHGKDEFDTVIQNLKYVYQYKKNLDRKLNVFVSYVETKYTPADGRKVKETFSGLCDEVVALTAKNPHGMAPEVNKHLKPEISNADLSFPNKIPCPMLFDNIHISYEGYITACCADFQNFLAFGDLNKVSLSEAWNNDTITEFRKRHLSGDIAGTLCENCCYDSLSKPSPLRKELCTDYDLSAILDDEEVKRRIRDYLDRTGG